MGVGDEGYETGHCQSLRQCKPMVSVAGGDCPNRRDHGWADRAPRSDGTAPETALKAHRAPTRPHVPNHGPLLTLP
jgi:hypothetical protein